MNCLIIWGNEFITHFFLNVLVCNGIYQNLITYTNKTVMSGDRNRAKLAFYEMIQKGDKLDRNCAEAFNETIVNEYFDLLERKMEELGISTHPRQMFTCDETFLPLDYTRERVVAARGAKTVYSLTTGTTDHITLLSCESAAGPPLTPMIIYAKSFPGGQYRFQGPD